MEKILQGNFFHEFFKKFLKPCYYTPENNDRQIARRLGVGFGPVKRYYFDTSEILAKVLWWWLPIRQPLPKLIRL